MSLPQCPHPARGQQLSVLALACKAKQLCDAKRFERPTGVVASVPQHIPCHQQSAQTARMLVMRARYNRGVCDVNSNSMEFTKSNDELFVTVRNAIAAPPGVIDETRFRGDRYDCIEMRYMWITPSLAVFSNSILECAGDLENDRYEKWNDELNILTP